MRAGKGEINAPLLSLRPSLTNSERISLPPVQFLVIFHYVKPSLQCLLLGMADVRRRKIYYIYSALGINQRDYVTMYCVVPTRKHESTQNRVLKYSTILCGGSVWYQHVLSCNLSALAIAGVSVLVFFFKYWTCLFHVVKNTHPGGVTAYFYRLTGIYVTATTRSANVFVSVASAGDYEITSISDSAFNCVTNATPRCYSDLFRLFFWLLKSMVFLRLCRFL